ncbi:MAG: hypothetical protein FWD63_06130 [Propionibacteriaceae bacterium]|nr:hypothetical protein [Propionibacteriaceae bacterium]
MKDHPIIERTSLSFAGYGEYRSVQWWLFQPLNRVALVVAILLVVFIVNGLVFDGSRGLLVWDAVTAVTVARYFMIAVADSKSGSDRLSWRAWWWWIAMIAEFVALVVYGFIASSSAR